MTAPPPLPASRKIWPTLLLGMFAANLVGGILYTLLFKFIDAHKESNLSVLAVPNLFLVPFVAGLVAAWFWRKLNRTISISILDSLWTSLLSLVAAFIFLHEGAVCLVMAFPALGDDFRRHSRWPMVVQSKDDSEIAAQHFSTGRFAHLPAIHSLVLTRRRK